MREINNRPSVSAILNIALSVKIALLCALSTNLYMDFTAHALRVMQPDSVE